MYVFIYLCVCVYVYIYIYIYIYMIISGSVLESVLTTEACKNGLPSVNDLLQHQ